MSRRITAFCAAGFLTAGIISTPTGPLWASGFDNTGIGSLDLLFDPARFALEGSYTYAVRNVEYESDNAQYSSDITVDPFPPNVRDVTTGARKAAATPDLWNYSVGAKAALNDNLACLARLNNPGTILEELPEDWNGRFATIKTELTSLGYDLTCALSFSPTHGHKFSIIGGGKYIQTEINVLKLSALVGAPSLAGVNLEGAGFGWRAGVAYEVPEYAIRASLFYDHETPIEATGSIQTLLPLDGKAEFAMPAALELRVQSGIAPRWLAFAGVKWVNWASLDKLTVRGGLGGNDLLQIDRIFNFSDGWTVTAGVGHQLTEKMQVGSSVTWDQGIGGPYSDTWQFGLGGSYKLTEAVTWSLGGALIYKTAASGEFVGSETGFGPLSDPNNPSDWQTIYKDRFDLSYDASVNFGLTTKLKISF